MFRFRLLCCAAGLFLTLASGCKKGGKDSDFVPSADKARSALEAALSNWRDGNPQGVVPGKSSPKIEMMDAGWQAERKLTSFEIVGEDPAGQGPRFFSVRLNLGDGTQVDARYVVMGIDPLLVMREEEFKKMSGSGQ